MTNRKLWNVCKRLCNAERIDALRKVMIALEPPTVSGLADCLRIKEPATSQYLAQLADECGLVVAERFGRYVTYRPEADPEDSKSEILVHLLKDYFRREADTLHLPFATPQPPPTFVSQLPALANEDRARICCHLRHTRSMTVPSLIKFLGQCESGVRRHLKIISVCGMGELQGATFIWHEPRDPMIKAILDLFDRGAPSNTPPVNYCNGTSSKPDATSKSP